MSVYVVCVMGMSTLSTYTHLINRARLSQCRVRGMTIPLQWMHGKGRLALLLKSPMYALRSARISSTRTPRLFNELYVCPPSLPLPPLGPLLLLLALLPASPPLSSTLPFVLTLLACSRGSKVRLDRAGRLVHGYGVGGGGGESVQGMAMQVFGGRSDGFVGEIILDL